MSRCTGQCCHYLTLGGPPEALAAKVERIATMVAENDPRLLEWRQILAMVRYRGLVGNPHRPGAPADHWYVCSHFDGASKNCTIYETRPQMCRAFPNGKPCPNPGCTWEDAPIPIAAVVRLR